MSRGGKITHMLQTTKWVHSIWPLQALKGLFEDLPDCIRRALDNVSAEIQKGVITTGL